MRTRRRIPSEKWRNNWLIDKLIDSVYSVGFGVGWGSRDPRLLACHSFVLFIKPIGRVPSGCKQRCSFTNPATTALPRQPAIQPLRSAGSGGGGGEQHPPPLPDFVFVKHDVPQLLLICSRWRVVNLWPWWHRQDELLDFAVKSGENAVFIGIDSKNYQNSENMTRLSTIMNI